MEFLLRYLPGPQPLAVRYGVSALLVLLAYGFRLVLGSFSGAYGFLFFILPIAGSALAFDRGTGFFAVAISGLLVATLLNWDARPGAHLGALVLFAIVGSCLVYIAEGLHRALEKAHASQRATELLLDEMSHRVKNKFAMVASIIELQARRSSPETRQALDDVASRVNIIATVHAYLQLSRHEGLIDVSEYVPGLCNSLKSALCDPRGISLTSSAVPAMLPPEKALSIGLIVNELVTNAVKYAFNEGRSGRVHVDLSQQQDRFVLKVIDDGRGCAPSREAGLGTRLITTFAGQLGGSATWSKSQAGGCEVSVDFSA